MKKIIFSFCLLFLFMSSTNGYAWSYGEFISCDGLNPNPIVTFKTSYGQLIHDISTPMAEIHAKRTLTEKGYLTAGLAHVKYAYGIYIKQYQIKYLDESATCILPKEIEVFLGYKEPIIYVAKEYDPQSCNFSHIIRHEQTHQRINKLTLDYFLPLLEKTIKKTIREVRSVKVPSRDDAQDGVDTLNKYYMAKMIPIVEEFEKARTREQAKLDNETNYSMEWDICKKYENNNPKPKTETKKKEP